MYLSPLLPYTVLHGPCTFCPAAPTLHPRPSTLGPVLLPYTQALHPTLHPESCTPDLKLYTMSPPPWTFHPISPPYTSMPQPALQVLHPELRIPDLPPSALHPTYTWILILRPTTWHCIPDLHYPGICTTDPSTPQTLHSMYYTLDSPPCALHSEAPVLHTSHGLPGLAILGTLGAKGGDINKGRIWQHNQPPELTKRGGKRQCSGAGGVD